MVTIYVSPMRSGVGLADGLELVEVSGIVEKGKEH
jgi:hypothetical protein